MPLTTSVLASCARAAQAGAAHDAEADESEFGGHVRQPSLRGNGRRTLVDFGPGWNARRATSPAWLRTERRGTVTPSEVAPRTREGHDERRAEQEKTQGEEGARQTVSLYEAIGGEPVVEKLVERFYDLMDTLPEAKACRDIHPPSLEGSSTTPIGVSPARKWSGSPSPMRAYGKCWQAGPFCRRM